jgi:hypothetical protein
VDHLRLYLPSHYLTEQAIVLAHDDQLLSRV